MSARKYYIPRYGIQFSNGGSAKISVADNSDLKPETYNKFSWACFFYARDLKVQSDQRLFDKSQHSLGILTDQSATPGTQNRINLRLTYNTTVYNFRSTTIISPFTWYHIAVTYDNGTVRMYLDGVEEVISGSGLVPMLDASSGALQLGNRNAGSRNWIGDMADVGVWQNKVLTESEIVSLAFGGTFPSDNNVLWYDFTNQGGSSVSDKSGNNYTGTLSNMDNNITSWRSYYQERTSTSEPSIGLNFTPDGSGCTMGTSVARPESTNKFTYMAWIFIREYTYNNLPFIMQKGSHYMSFMGEKNPPNRRNTQMALEVANAADSLATEYWSSKRLKLHAWSHVCITFDMGITRMYINGILDNSVIVNGNWDNSGLEGTASSPFVIGNRWHAGAFVSGASNRSVPGIISKVRYYDTALSGDEVRQAYVLDNVNRGIVGKWNLDEGTGTIAKDTAGSNDGTISGAIWETTAGSRQIAGDRLPAERLDI